MPLIPRAILKTFFEAGDKPTQGQFSALIDSYVHLIEDRGLIGLRDYSVTLGYSAGDTVIHDGNLYQCIATTSGAFDLSKWKLLQALGAVVYAGTWNASSNSPTLSDATGVKGFYYVVAASGTQDLGSGPIDFKATDWVVHNGTRWEQVDNTEDQTAIDIAFTPDGDITATNVQDAVVMVRDTTDTKLDDKADKVSGAVNGNLAALDANGNLTDAGATISNYIAKDNSTTYTPSGDYNPATKKICRRYRNGAQCSGQSR